jgi:hypothetical protein
MSAETVILLVFYMCRVCVCLVCVCVCACVWRGERGGGVCVNVLYSFPIIITKVAKTAKQHVFSVRISFIISYYATTPYNPTFVLLLPGGQYKVVRLPVSLYL